MRVCAGGGVLGTARCVCWRGGVLAQDSMGQFLSSSSPLPLPAPVMRSSVPRPCLCLPPTDTRFRPLPCLCLPPTGACLRRPRSRTAASRQSCGCRLSRSWPRACGVRVRRGWRLGSVRGSRPRSRRSCTARPWVRPRTARCRRRCCGGRRWRSCACRRRCRPTLQHANCRCGGAVTYAACSLRVIAPWLPPPLLCCMQGLYLGFVACRGIVHVPSGPGLCELLGGPRLPPPLFAACRIARRTGPVPWAV